MLDYLSKKQWTPGVTLTRRSPERRWSSSAKDSIRALSRPYLVHHLGLGVGVLQQQQPSPQPSLQPSPRVTALQPTSVLSSPPQTPTREAQISPPRGLARGAPSPATSPSPAAGRGLAAPIAGLGGMSIRLKNREPAPLANSSTEGGSSHGPETLLASLAAEASTVLPVIHAARSCTAPSHGYRSRSPPPLSEACRAAPEGATAGVATTSGRSTGTPFPPDHSEGRPRRPSSRAAGGGTVEASRSGRHLQKPAARPQAPDPEVQRRKRQSYTPEEIIEFQQQAHCRVLQRQRAMTAEPRTRKVSDHSTRQSLDSFQRRTEMRLEEHTRVALDAIAPQKEKTQTLDKK